MGYIDEAAFQRAMENVAYTIGSGGGIRIRDVGSGPITIGYYADEKLAMGIDDVTGLLDVVASGGAVYRALENPAEYRFATATEDQLQSMIGWADAGRIELSDYWKVGDSRTVKLTDGSSYTMVLMDTGPYAAADGTKTSFIWGFQECLRDIRKMNESDGNAGGWDASDMRKWLNSDVYNKLPSWLKSATKTVSVVSDAGTDTAVPATSQDRLFIPAEVEVFGSASYGMGTANSMLHQWKWYKTASNRVKAVNGSASCWWERSCHSDYNYYFCVVDSGGSASSNNADNDNGVAVSGCI